MDSDKLLERSLEASGDYLDSTIKSLKELHLESTQAALSATSYTSENGQKEAVQSSVKGTVTNGDVDTTKRGVLCRTAAARRPPVRAAIASGHRRPCSRRAHIHPLAVSQWREDWIQIILVLYQSSRSPGLQALSTCFTYQYVLTASQD